MVIIDDTQLYQQQALGQRLRSLRHARSLTLRDLAWRLGVKYQTISRWELGNMRIGDKSLRRISNFFNVRPEWLETGNGASQPELDISPFPTEDVRREWGIDLNDIPNEWPSVFKDFLSAAVMFGMSPSVAGLENMLDRAKTLGTKDRFWTGAKLFP